MLEYSDEEIVDNFLDHIRYLTIAHHVKGRIRVKADLWNGARKLAQVKDSDIHSLIARIPGVLEYRINKKALSVVINYDPAILSFSLWEAIGALNENPLPRDEIAARLLAILKQHSPR